MDKTEQFIKMSDCPEIQGQWKPREGDYFSFIGDIHILSNYEISALEKKEPSDIDCWNEIVTLMGGHFVDHWNECRGSFVWLPRQGQIQEMMGIKDTSLLIHKFNKFCYRDSITNLIEGGSYLVFQFPISISMEQLWLAFYMWEKHSKIWSSKEEKWVRR